MVLSARALLTGVVLAALSLPISLPAEAPPTVDPRNRCVAEANDPLVVHAALPAAASTDGHVLRRARVRVELSVDGIVRHVRLLAPSGDAGFDRAAARATAATAFAPAARGCIAIDDSFEYGFLATPGGDVAAAVVPGSAELVAHSR